MRIRSRYIKHYQQIWRYHNHISVLVTLTNSYLTTCAYALALRRASLTSALALLLKCCQGLSLEGLSHQCWLIRPPWTKCPPFSRWHFQMYFLEWKFCISSQISLKSVPKDPIDDKSALVQVMAWCQRGNKPLPETMHTQFTKDCLILMSLCLSHHWFIQEFTILLETSHQRNWWWFVCRNWGMHFHGILTKATNLQSRQCV